VSDNGQRRKLLRRALQGAGGDVSFVPPPAAEQPAAGSPLADADLVVLDVAAGGAAVDVERVAADTRAELVVFGDSALAAGMLGHLRAANVNHLMADGAASDEEALLITSGKVCQGDLFGLEKYLAWGARVHERTVTGYDDKRRALLEIEAFAAETGARRTQVARIAAVTDELLMNALYDAPAVRHGLPLAAVRTRPVDEPALLRYASDGACLAVSVRDEFGELRKPALLDCVERARALRSAREEAGAGGAGLGLWFVLSAVTRFVANIDPGRATEVIGLFDLRASGRELDAEARSLHFFTTAHAG
jgi:hypothetical protein